MNGVKTIEVILPEKPSDDVALHLSNLHYGFNMTERIKDGRAVYRQLRKMLLKEQTRSLDKP